MKIKYLFYFILFSSCKQKPIDVSIKKIRPYITSTIFTDSDTTESKFFEFTLEIKSGGEKEIVDSLQKFIQLNYKSEFDTLRPILDFTFWKYEKGRFDENYFPTYSDRDIMTSGTALFGISWLHGKFYHIEMRDNGNLFWLDSVGNRIKKIY